MFTAGQRIDVTGVSQGKGFSGQHKRHNFHRGPVSHGSHNIKQAGSIGSTDAARVFKGLKMAGQHGATQVTVRNLEVVRVDTERNLLLVHGSVPGHKNQVVHGPRQRPLGDDRSAGMSTARVVDQAGVETGSVELPEAIFGIEPNEPVMHQALIRQLANGRQGTASTKTRSDVRGGGRKPYRQKGTGRARQGSTRSPQWEGGGVVFGPHPRSYRMDMPRKQRRLALRSALSAKAQDGGLLVLEGFELEAPKHQGGCRPAFAASRRRAGCWSCSARTTRCSRRARATSPRSRLTLAGNLSVRDIIGADTVIVTRDAIEHIEEAFA